MNACWPNRYEGIRYDCGSKLGYLKATTAMGLKHSEVGDEFCRYLQEVPVQHRRRRQMTVAHHPEDG